MRPRSSSIRSTRTRSDSFARCRGTASASRQRALSTIPGNLPQIGTDLPTCVFVDRCPLADELCRTVVPPIVEVAPGRWTRCHHRDRLGEIVEPPTRGRPGHRPRRSRPVAGERLQDLPPERPRRPGPGQGRPRAVRRRDARPRRRVRLRASRRWPGRSSASSSPDAGRDRRARRRTRSRRTSASRPTDDKRSIQMVFQNPDSALNRGWTARHILSRSVTQADRA